MFFLRWLFIVVQVSFILQRTSVDKSQKMNIQENHFAISCEDEDDIADISQTERL